MAEAGDHQRVRESRLYFQHASEQEFVAAVEDITGRAVWAFTSGMDVHADLATEAFHPYPVGTPSGQVDGSTPLVQRRPFRVR